MYRADMRTVIEKNVYKSEGVAPGYEIIAAAERFEIAEKN